jgi:hypothetical protein
LWPLIRQLLCSVLCAGTTGASFWIVSVLVSKDDAASLLLDLFRIQAGHLKQIIQVLEIAILLPVPDQQSCLLWSYGKGILQGFSRSGIYLNQLAEVGRKIVHDQLGLFIRDLRAPLHHLVYGDRPLLSCLPLLRYQTQSMTLGAGAREFGFSPAARHQGF